MADPRHPRGLIDTSVVIDLELIEPADLPVEVAVSAVTNEFRAVRGILGDIRHHVKEMLDLRLSFLVEKA